MQVDVWYASTDGSTPLRISSTQTQNAFGFVTTTSLITKEILEWEVASIGPSAFAHCTPNTTTTTA